MINKNNYLINQTLRNQNNADSRWERISPISDIFVLVVLIIYTVILIIGIIGNVLTCSIVLFQHSMRRSIHLYTVNLSVADIFILLFYAPIQMRFIMDNMDWKMGVFVCKLANSVVPLTLQSSIGTLVAISIDRHRGLNNPFAWRAQSKKHAKIIIPVIWITAVATAIPLVYYCKIVTDPILSINVCYEKFSSNPLLDSDIAYVYWTTIALVQYIIPLLVISFVNIHIAKIVYNSRDRLNLLHKRMFKMVAVLLITYLICTGMQHLSFFINHFDSTFRENVVAPYLFIISNLLVCLQAAINPLIYGTSRNDYKNSYKEIIKAIILRFRVFFYGQENCWAVSESMKKNTENITPMLFRSTLSNTVADNSLSIPTTRSTVIDYDTDSEGENIRKQRYSKRLDTIECFDDKEFENMKHLQKRKRKKRKTISMLLRMSYKNESLESLPTFQIATPEITENGLKSFLSFDKNKDSLANSDCFSKLSVRDLDLPINDNRITNSEQIRISVKNSISTTPSIEDNGGYSSCSEGFLEGIYKRLSSVPADDNCSFNMNFDNFISNVEKIPNFTNFYSSKDTENVCEFLKLSYSQIALYIQESEESTL